MRGLPRTILVTGASGFIGRHVCDAALEAGYRVCTLTRRDWLGRPWVPVANRFLGAFPFDLPEAGFEGVDGIVHLVGTTRGEGEGTAEAINVEGTRRLLDLAQRHRAGKIVFLSSQSAHPSAASAYGKSKLEAERLLLEGPVPVTIIRPGLVYGDGDGGLFARMHHVARRSPILPLPDGGKAVLQPIHVDDLVEAIFTCLDGGKYAGEVLRLGDPNGVTLADLLRITAGGGPRRQKIVVPVPIEPVFRIVKALESKGLRLPIAASNLQGLAKIEWMPTEPDLRRLGLTLRPLSEGLAGAVDRRADAAPSRSDTGPDHRALRVVLVGAGRIGMIHAISIERQQGMRLAAVVDSNHRAIGVLRKVGLKAPGYRSLEEAVGAVRPDAVVIATPPSSHYALVRAGVAAGLGVLVEKPLAASREHLDRFAEMTSDPPIQVGYFAPSYPHFRAAVDRLRAGRFGRVRGFEAFCLLSYFPGTKRWETSQAHSAGGVLINSGGHIFSMIRDAFGPPRSLTAQHMKRSSRHAEDSVVAALDYDAFSGRVWSCWAIEGFAQPENRLVVSTDAGTLWCNNSAAAFISRDQGGEWFSHQLDADVGFNFAPDTVGAGIASELRQLQRMVREGARPAMDVGRALEIDRMLFTIYEQSQEVAEFSAHTMGSDQRKPEPAAASPAPRVGNRSTPIVLDLRRIGGAELPAATRGLAERGDLILVRVSQVEDVLAAGVPPQRITVVVPDFLSHARMLSSGRSLEFFKRLGVKPSLAFAWQAALGAVSDRGLGVWTAIESMLAAELSVMRRDFLGTVLIDSFPTDLAVSLNEVSRLDALIGLVRSRLASAAIGLQTNMLPEAANLLVYLRRPVQVVHFLTSPHNARLERTIALLRSSPHGARWRLVGEARSLPAAAHAMASGAPEDWANGAEALVVDAVGHPDLVPFVRNRLAEAWTRAFPGSPFPEAAL